MNTRVYQALHLHIDWSEEATLLCTTVLLSVLIHFDEIDIRIFFIYRNSWLKCDFKKKKKKKKKYNNMDTNDTHMDRTTESNPDIDMDENHSCISCINQRTKHLRRNSWTNGVLRTYFYNYTRSIYTVMFMVLFCLSHVR